MKTGPQMVLDLERALWRRHASPRHCVQLLKDGLVRFPDDVGLAARLGMRYRELADWSHVPQSFAAKLSECVTISAPFDLHFFTDDPNVLAQAAAAAAKYHCALAPSTRASRPSRDPKGRLRIGYVSGDFREHPLGQLAIGLIECHDKARFEIFGYGTLASDGSDLHKRFLVAFDHYRSLAGSEAGMIVEAIQQDCVDILVHLSGYTHGGRCEILHVRPAPIIVNYLGFPGTLGTPAVDYIIGDPVVFGDDVLPHLYEAPVLLPDTYQPNRRFPSAVSSTRSAHGLPQNALVLACFCSVYKINEPVFARWMSVLRRVPEAVLWLLDNPHTQPGARLRDAAASHGVDADRIVMAPWMHPAAHLARLPLADLALDTTPYGAHTTASDILWAGVPMVALLGRSFAARVSASLLRAANLPDLVATDLDQYEQIILALAQDSGRLLALRRHLVDGRNTLALFDAARLTAHLETAFEIMWGRYCAGEGPRGFSVVPAQGSGKGSTWPNWAR